ncbi:MAG: glutathione S-transferase, partial [Parasphingorhabdus sp.]
NSDTHKEDFLAMNPNAKIPLLKTEEGTCLPESNAILNYLADGSDYLPGDRMARARVLQWQFFEQYSHEPTVAVARFIRLFLKSPQERLLELEQKQVGAHKALAVMERQLLESAYIAGEQFTIADISLYAYTHVADDAAISLNDYPGIKNWLARIESRPRHLTMQQASEKIVK